MQESVATYVLGFLVDNKVQLHNCVDIKPNHCFTSTGSVVLLLIDVEIKNVANNSFSHFRH